MSDRNAFAAGLHALADWLETTPTAPLPTADRLLVPLRTNTAVEEFAAGHGFEAEFDDDGNAHCQIKFGSVTYFVYGYADFTTFADHLDERTARKWADRKGMTIQLEPGV